MDKVVISKNDVKYMVENWTLQDYQDFFKAEVPEAFLPADLSTLYAIGGQIPTLAMGEGLGTVIVCQLAQVGDGALNRRSLLLNNNYFNWEFDGTSFPGYVVAKPFKR